MSSSVLMIESVPGLLTELVISRPTLEYRASKDMLQDNRANTDNPKNALELSGSRLKLYSLTRKQSLDALDTLKETLNANRGKSRRGSTGCIPNADDVKMSATLIQETLGRSFSEHVVITNWQKLQTELIAETTIPDNYDKSSSELFADPSNKSVKSGIRSRKFCASKLTLSSPSAQRVTTEKQCTTEVKRSQCKLPLRKRPVAVPIKKCSKKTSRVGSYSRSPLRTEVQNVSSHSWCSEYEELCTWMDENVDGTTLFTQESCASSGDCSNRESPSRYDRSPKVYGRPSLTKKATSLSKIERVMEVLNLCPALSQNSPFCKGSSEAPILCQCDFISLQSGLALKSEQGRHLLRTNVSPVALLTRTCSVSQLKDEERVPKKEVKSESELPRSWESGDRPLWIIKEGKCLK